MSIVDATDPTKPLTSDKVKQLVDEIKALKTRINAVVADLGLNYLATADDNLTLPTIAGHTLGTLTATTTGLAWTQPNSFTLPAIVSSAVLTSNAGGTALEWKTFPALGSTVPGNLNVIGNLTVGTQAGGNVVLRTGDVGLTGNFQTTGTWVGIFAMNLPNVYMNVDVPNNNVIYNMDANDYHYYDRELDAYVWAIAGNNKFFVDQFGPACNNDATTAKGLARLSQVSNTNLLVNSNFAINQRAYVSGTATAAANQVTLDRWRVVTSGQNLTFAASGSGNQVAAPAAGIEQVIEGLDIQGGVYTLSWTGTAGGFVNGTVVANGGQITLPAATDATVKFWQGTASNAKLELSPVATQYQVPQRATELMKCQRDYEVGASSIGGYGNSANLNFCPVPFKATKRAVPTLTYALISVANCSVFDVRGPSLDHLVIACQPAVTGGYIWDCSWTAATGY